MSAGLGPWLLSLALALGPAGLWAQWRLQEDGGGLQMLGKSVRLSCRGSGFTLGHYNVLWYRQSPRGSFEWVSFINPLGHGQHNRAAVQDRATTFWNNAQSETYLSLQALQPQDSARYFCAIHTGTGNPAEL
ncbi:HV01 protein, partial [Sakesphorus luctuosus]|nr:HV01 protein [Sakesphorus luctuosus]